MNLFTLINSSSSSQCHWCCMLYGVGTENMDAVDVDAKTVFPPVYILSELSMNSSNFFLSQFPLTWRTLLIHLTLLLLIRILLFFTVYGTCMSIKFFMSPFHSSHLAITFLCTFRSLSSLFIVCDISQSAHTSDQAQAEEKNSNLS